MTPPDSARLGRCAPRRLGSLPPWPRPRPRPPPDARSNLVAQPPPDGGGHIASRGGASADALAKVGAPTSTRKELLFRIQQCLQTRAHEGQKITQRQLASQIGVAQGTLSKWTNNEGLSSTKDVEVHNKVAEWLAAGSSANDSVASVAAEKGAAAGESVRLKTHSMAASRGCDDAA